MVNKIDSNFTGLRIAEEDSIGVVSGNEVWKPLEPNSYGDFGAQLTLLARTPIQASRQRKKGVITDLDAKASFPMDFTQTNMYDVLQGYFFADWRAQADQAPTDVDGTSNGYSVTSETGYLPGHLVLAKNFGSAANNGLKKVSVVSAGEVDVTDTGLVDEAVAPSDADLKVVGGQFAAGVLSVDHSSATTDYIIASLVAASKVLTITDFDNANDETVTVDGVEYTFKTALSTGPTVPYEVLIGGSVANSVINLNKAINDSGTEGTHYSVGTEAHPTVTSVTNSTSTVTVTAIAPGVSGNLIAISETLTDGSWAGAATKLSGGSGINWIDLGVIPGSWLFVGGDSAGLKFTTAGNNGFVRCSAVDYDTLTVDKTAGTTADEAGGALTVQVFTGDVIKNEADPDLIVRRSYQLERSLSTAGYEYVAGCVPNTFAMQIQTANKITCELGFVATDSEQTDTRKDGTFPDLVESDAFNTSSDFARLRLATKDALSTPLFAFLSELTLSINNNVSPDKAVAVLGAFDVTAGDFAIEGSMTAYFADIDALQAVRDNADVTLDFSVVKNNSGWVFDVPLLSLGDGRLNVTKDQPIKIPLTVAGAQDPDFDHTFLACSFAYLPNAAE